MLYSAQFILHDVDNDESLIVKVDYDLMGKGENQFVTQQCQDDYKEGAKFWDMIIN